MTAPGTLTRKLFAASLPFEYSDEALRTLFSQAGTVRSAVMVPDRKNRRSRGFGFVEMATEDEAAQAIARLNGLRIGDKAIWVTEAKPRDMPSAARPAPTAEGRPKTASFRTRRDFLDRRRPRAASPPDQRPFGALHRGRGPVPGRGSRFRQRPPIPPGGRRPRGARRPGPVFRRTNVRSRSGQSR